jgi:Domain of unknown function (DUF4136)
MNRHAILILILAPAAVVHAVAEEVHVDYDHGCTFSRYKTYAWEQQQRPPSSRALFPNQLMQERIVRFVEEALAAKGLARTETGADVLVAYQMKVTEEPQVTTYADSFGPGWGWGNWGCCAWSGAWGGGWGALSTTTTEMIQVGTLVINLTDSHQKQLVFQGLSTTTISSKPQKNIKRLQKGVSEIFEKYPPQKKS